MPTAADLSGKNPCIALIIFSVSSVVGVYRRKYHDDHDDAGMQDLCRNVSRDNNGYKRN